MMHFMRNYTVSDLFDEMMKSAKKLQGGEDRLSGAPFFYKAICDANAW